MGEKDRVPMFLRVRRTGPGSPIRLPRAPELGRLSLSFSVARAPDALLQGTSGAEGRSTSDDGQTDGVSFDIIAASILWNHLLFCVHYSYYYYFPLEETFLRLHF
jgi:hypothetical protein